MSQGASSEDTVFHTMDLPEGTDWVWHGDLNLVALASRLDCAGRARAIDDLQAQWRRAHLRLVDSL